MTTATTATSDNAGDSKHQLWLLRHKGFLVIEAGKMALADALWAFKQAWDVSWAARAGHYHGEPMLHHSAAAELWLFSRRTVASER